MNGALLRNDGERMVDDLSLEGIVFYTQQSNPLKLLNGFSTYGNGYRAPGWRKDPSVCLLSGLMAGSSNPARSSIATLPLDCRPPNTLTFTVMQHLSTTITQVMVGCLCTCEVHTFQPYLGVTMKIHKFLSCC